jgi:energy-coupling factor transport system substrate-specific component
MTRRGNATSAMPVTARTAIVLALASVVGVLAFGWPLLIDPNRGLAHGTDAPLVLAVVLLCVLAVVFVAMSDGGIDVKAIAVLGLLSAIGSVLRPLSAGTAGVELVFLGIVLGGRVFGPGFGFALGSTTLLTSALLTGGVGPWLPFQMLAASWVGLGAGLLPRRVRGRREVVVVALYAAAAGLGYGLVMDLSFWPCPSSPGTRSGATSTGSCSTASGRRSGGMWGARSPRRSASQSWVDPCSRSCDAPPRGRRSRRRRRHHI